MNTGINLPGISTAVIVRGLLTIIAAINIFLGYLDIRILPFTDADVGTLVDGVIVTITAAIWAWGWWKNNSLTLNAQIADEVLNTLSKEE